MSYSKPPSARPAELFSNANALRSVSKRLQRTDRSCDRHENFSRRLKRSCPRPKNAANDAKIPPADPNGVARNAKRAAIRQPRPLAWYLRLDYQGRRVSTHVGACWQVELGGGKGILGKGISGTGMVAS